MSDTAEPVLSAGEPESFQSKLLTDISIATIRVLQEITSHSNWF
jgi:hypothetical protein